MATAAVLVKPEEMECPVCHEYFTDPKILPCAHLLCRHCLVSWLKSEKDAHCPQCRCVIVDPDEKFSETHDELADALPTDVVIAGVVDSYRKLQEKHVCCVCEDMVATFICLDCRDMMCSTCLKAHKKFSATQHHTTEELSSMTAERLAASSGRTPCSAHASEQAKLFCPSHGVSICHICATSKHRACPEVTELEDKLEEARRVLGEQVVMLSEGENKLKQAIRQLDEHLLVLEKKTEATLSDIDAVCDRLKKSVDTCRQRLRDVALSAKSEAKAAVQDGKSVFVERRGKLTSHKQVVTRAKGISNPTCADEVKTCLKTRVEGLDRSAILPAGSKVISIPMLRLEQQAIEKVLKELEGLGQLEQVPALQSLQKPQQINWSFHANHGQNIVLSNNQRTAERVRGDDHGIVLSSQPMEVSTLYEVVIELDDRNQMYSDHGMFVGVITEDPARFNFLQYASHLSDPKYVIFHPGYCSALGTTKHGFTIGDKLRGAPVGSRVGLYVDAARSLHFVFDGCDQGIVHHNIPQPCYALFDLYLKYKKLTAQPLRAMPGDGTTTESHAR